MIDPILIPAQKKIWGETAGLVIPEVGVSILKVEAGFRCSIHLHKHRWNSFSVISGGIEIGVYQPHPVLGHILQDQYLVLPGESLSIPPETIHSFAAIDSGTVVETYWTTDGTPVDMGDIVRFIEGCKLDV